MSQLLLAVCLVCAIATYVLKKRTLKFRNTWIARRYHNAEFHNTLYSDGFLSSAVCTITGRKIDLEGMYAELALYVDAFILKLHMVNVASISALISVIRVM